MSGGRDGLVLLGGDTHGNAAHVRYLLDTADRTGADRIFQVGDFGYWPHEPDGLRFLGAVNKLAGQRGRRVHWLDGNHDKSSAIDRTCTDEDGFVVIADNIRYAPRGHRWTWSGVRFIALGGAYSTDKAWRVEEERARHAALLRAQPGWGQPDLSGTLWFPEEELTDAELAGALADAGPVDVMLTHDKPRASQPGWNRKDLPECMANQDRIQAAVTALRPRLLVHGHLHYRYEDRIRCGEDAWTRVIGLDCDPWGAQSNAYRRRDSWTLLTLPELEAGQNPQQ